MSDFSSKNPENKSSYNPHTVDRKSIGPGAGRGDYMKRSHRPDFAGPVARKKGQPKGRGAYMKQSYRPDFAGPVVQKQLKIGSSNDPLEKEADAVADKVMRMPGGGANTVRRQEAAPEEEGLAISRKEKSGGEAAITSGTQAKIESARGGGQGGKSVQRDFNISSNNSANDVISRFPEPPSQSEFVDGGILDIDSIVQEGYDGNIIVSLRKSWVPLKAANLTWKIFDSQDKLLYEASYFLKGATFKIPKSIIKKGKAGGARHPWSVWISVEHIAPFFSRSKPENFPYDNKKFYVYKNLKNYFQERKKSKSKHSKENKTKSDAPISKNHLATFKQLLRVKALERINQNRKKLKELRKTYTSNSPDTRKTNRLFKRLKILSKEDHLIEKRIQGLWLTKQVLTQNAGQLVYTGNKAEFDRQMGIVNSYEQAIRELKIIRLALRNEYPALGTIDTGDVSTKTSNKDLFGMLNEGFDDVSEAIDHIEEKIKGGDIPLYKLGPLIGKLKKDLGLSEKNRKTDSMSKAVHDWLESEDTKDTRIRFLLGGTAIVLAIFSLFAPVGWGLVLGIMAAMASIGSSIYEFKRARSLFKLERAQVSGKKFLTDEDAEDVKFNYILGWVHLGLASLDLAVIGKSGRILFKAAAISQKLRVMHTTGRQVLSSLSSEDIVKFVLLLEYRRANDVIKVEVLTKQLREKLGRARFSRVESYFAKNQRLILSSRQIKGPHIFFYLKNLSRSALTRHSIILDNNMAIALERSRKGLELNEAQRLSLDKLKSLRGKTDWRITDVVAQELRDFDRISGLERGIIAGARRNSREYKDVLHILETITDSRGVVTPVGKAKGINDRFIVADALFARGTQRTLITADKGIFRPLANHAGIEITREIFKNGFTVNIAGRSLHIIPAGRFQL